MRWYVYGLLMMAALWFAFVFSLTSCSETAHDCFDGCGDTNKGETGDVGERGEPGTPGENGTSCRVESSGDGCSQIQCGDSTARICSGNDGRDGAPGNDGERGPSGDPGMDGKDATGIAVVTPCPESAGSVPYPERFIRFNDGTLVAFYSDPDYRLQRLVTLITGATYVTTDGRNCQFVAE